MNFKNPTSDHDSWGHVIVQVDMYTNKNRETKVCWFFKKDLVMNKGLWVFSKKEERHNNSPFTSYGYDYGENYLHIKSLAQKSSINVGY